MSGFPGRARVWAEFHDEPAPTCTCRPRRRAGPVAAIALQKARIDSVVYEAQPCVGVFHALASNGIDALRVLGADEPAVAAGFPTPAITLRRGTGKPLGESRTGQTLPDDLYRVLRGPIPRTLR